MLLTGEKTAVVSSTDLKRKYGIFFPYSKKAIEAINDIIENIEMNKNSKKLIEEFKKSYASDKKKRISLKDV